MILGIEPRSQIASLAARAGRAGELADRVQALLGIVLPHTPRLVTHRDLTVLWSGPDRWLVVAAPEAPPQPALDVRLREHLGALATVVDQSDGRVVLTVRGANAADALARLVGLDLHPRAFRPGDTALTLAAHIPVQLWQTDDAPHYALAVARSLADSLHDALCTAAAGYGVELAA